MTYDCSLKQVGHARFTEISSISRNYQNTTKQSLKVFVDNKRKMATILVSVRDVKVVSLDKELLMWRWCDLRFLGSVDNGRKFWE